MKKSYLYIASALLALTAFTSCDGDQVLPPMVVPTATIEANTTIAELKDMYWSTDANYVNTIGTREADGEHIIIKGRVCSSDESGNIYKSLMIEDGTAALTVAINAYDLYESYHFGQEVIIDVTDMQIGGYNGLMQLGGEGTYNSKPSMTFMSEDVMTAHAQVNGLGRPQDVDTVTTTIPTLATAKTTPEGLRNWQSRLIRIDNVQFEDAGKPFAGESTTNRYVVDADGNRINVRNSSYADFKNDILPAGYGSIVGILSYYGSDWQILLIDASGCVDFNSVDVPVFSVASGNVEEGTKVAISCATEGAAIYYTTDGSTPSATNGTLYTDPIEILETTTIKAIAVKEGQTDSPVVTATYVTATAATSVNQNFDAETAIPADWSQVQIEGTKTWYVTTYNNNNYAAMTGYKGTAPFDSWLISPAISASKLSKKTLNFSTQVNGYSSTTSVFEVYVLSSNDVKTATKTQLNPTLATAPASGYSSWTDSGNVDLSAFTGTIYIGFRYYATTDSNYATWCLDNVVIE
jgi:hypothetical protein